MNDGLWYKGDEIKLENQCVLVGEIIVDKTYIVSL